VDAGVALHGLRTRLLIEPGTAADLEGRDPADRLDLGSKADADALRQELITEIALLQNRLFAEAERSVLLVLQGMDTSGKDGTIRHVFTGVNPQGVAVTSFRAPSEPELAHDYLRRIHAACPARGMIGVFNRSHYEDVVAVGTRGLLPPERWRRRLSHLTDFERMLSDEGTTVVKVFLHISQKEQKERLEARLANPEKRWKFRVEDLADRARWDDYRSLYQQTLTTTSTGWAPWYVVPADRKWVRNVAVAALLLDVLREMDPTVPSPTEDLASLVVD
jgi:PPK2 family polyphosphate:nucleotide phosphotransferase